MAINPISMTRVSHNLQSNSLLTSLRQNQVDLFATQARISSGRAFVSPSEDPLAAARALDLTQALGRQEQFVSNLTHGDNILGASDEAITEVNSLLIEVNAIASQNVSNLTSAAERESVAEVISGIIGQLLVVGNRELGGRYIFAGRDTTDPPFVRELGGIAYRGDTGNLFTRVSDDTSAITNISGDVLFGALSSRIAGTIDLSPSLQGAMRLDDVNGTRGQAIAGGTLVFNEVGGAGTFRAALNTVDTLGDVAAAINAAATQAGASLTASVSDTGLQITPGNQPVTIGDANAGVIAANLGITTVEPTTAVVDGLPLTARLTRLTPVADLARGAGIDLTSGMIVTNGTVTTTIDFSAAETVQDMINIINNAGAGLFAEINPEATGIDVFNRISGTSLTIGENGGTTASDLGLRTMNTATLLQDVNFGLGVETVAGEPDLQIQTQDGSTVDVNLDQATTVGDVIDLINAAATDASVSVTASLTDVGNGIRITDGTSGSASLAVVALGNSTAVFDLNLNVTADPSVSEIVSTDTVSSRPEGILGALLDLERALRQDDTRAITQAGERIETFSAEVNRIQGIVGARSQAMRAKLTQTQDATQTTQLFLSQVEDLDFAEAVTRMQSLSTQLQASFQVGSLMNNLSLLNFLG